MRYTKLWSQTKTFQRSFHLPPYFLNFKVSNNHLLTYITHSYDSCRRLLLYEEIKLKDATISDLRNELKIIKDELQLSMSFLDYTHVVSCLSQVVDKYIVSRRIVQDKKLCNLLKRSRVSQNDPDKVIHNLSDYELSSTEKSILVKGLNYSIGPGKLNYADYCAQFEQLFVDIKNNAELSHYNLDIVKDKLKEVALSSFKGHNNSPNRYSNLNKEELDCLKVLLNNENIII